MIMRETDKEDKAMKVCALCGEEIGTKDGDNVCESCERKELRTVQARRNRREREAALRDCGLVKVRGNLGGIYWE